MGKNKDEEIIQHPKINVKEIKDKLKRICLLFVTNFVLNVANTTQQQQRRTSKYKPGKEVLKDLAGERKGTKKKR